VICVVAAKKEERMTAPLLLKLALQLAASCRGLALP
jgi:hypothetical protein